MSEQVLHNLDMSIFNCKVKRGSVIVISEIYRVTLSDKSFKLSKISLSSMVNNVHFWSLFLFNLLKLESFSINNINVVVIKFSNKLH